MDLEGTEVTNNTAMVQGGGLALGPASNTTLNDVTVSSNGAHGGDPLANGIGYFTGAVYNLTGTTTDQDDPNGKPVLI